MKVEKKKGLIVVLGSRSSIPASQPERERVWKWAVTYKDRPTLHRGPDGSGLPLINEYSHARTGGGSFLNFFFLSLSLLIFYRHHSGHLTGSFRSRRTGALTAMIVAASHRPSIRSSADLNENHFNICNSPSLITFFFVFCFYLSKSIIFFVISLKRTGYLSVKVWRETRLLILTEIIYSIKYKKRLIRQELWIESCDLSYQLDLV